MHDGFLKKSRLRPCWLLLLPLGCFLFLYLSLGDGFVYTQWSVRDMVRSLRPLADFQTMGAELDFGSGMRLPGGLLHYLWALPLAFSSDPAVSFYFVQFLNIAAAAGLFLLIRRYSGTGAALAGLCFYLASDVFFIVAGRLWNPAFLPPFMVWAFYCACRVIIDGRGGCAKWFILALALGMQMHMSILLLLLPFLLSVAVFAPGRCEGAPRAAFFVNRAFWREAALCVLFFLLALSPYIVHEAAHGFANTRMLGGQHVFGQALAAGGLRRLPLMAWGMFFHFLPFNFEDVRACGVPGALCLSLGNAAFLFCLAGAALSACAGFGRKREHAPAARLAFFMACLFAVGLVYYSAADSAVLINQPRRQRYLYFLLPGLSAFAGLGYAFFNARLKARRAARGWALSALLCAGLLVWAQFGALGRRRVPGDELSFRDIKTRYRAVQNLTGWPLEDIAGRVMFRAHDKRYGWLWSFLVDCTSFQLACRGGDFPGSGPAPGVIFLLRAADIVYNPLENENVTDANFARVFLKQEVPGFHILEKRLIGRDLMILYSREDGGRAFSSMTCRYLPTAAEREILPFYGRLEAGQARKLPSSAGGLRRFVFNAADVFYAMVELEPGADGRLRARLHSNQLRGPSYNNGFFEDVLLRGPRLVFAPVDGGAGAQMSFAAGMVGFNGVLAPLSAEIGLGPGRYNVFFEAENVGNKDDFIYRDFVADNDLDTSRIRVGLGVFEVARN